MNQTIDHQDTPPPPRNWFTRFLDVVEWLGNLLPHPVTLFALLATAMVFLSGLFGWLGISVTDPRPGTEGQTIEAVSLLNAEGVRMIFGNLVSNFVNFAPLGVVLVAMLGVGVAEKSGLLSAVVRGIVLNAPKHLVTVAVVFAGVISNTASEMGYVVLVPLAGAIFLALGRHPLAGMAAAFAGVSGGYSANLLLGTIDPLLAGITTEAAQLIDPDYEVFATANWYFMIVSTFMITAVGSLVTIFIVEPKLGKYDDSRADPSVLDDSQMSPLTGKERKGLVMAGLALVSVIALIAILVVPEGGVLRDPGAAADAGFIESSGPFFRSIVAWIFVFFLATGFAYGKVVGTMNNDRDVIDGMASAISTLGLYIVLVFFAAQFVAFFGWTNIGLITAVAGADFLKAINLTGPLVFFFFIIMCGIVNLSLGSASAQWAVTAPIFVPMLMFIGYSPEVIQGAYRIGDSTTNIITPMMSYFGLILAWATRYDKNFGIGTLIATMLPYSIFYFIFWVGLFFLWVFGLGLPVGPGSPTFYTPPGG